jgi:hypothetical protein
MRFLIRADAARFSAQEAFPAVHRSALSRFEGHGGFTAALRARGHGFGLSETATPWGTLTLHFARLAAFGFVLKTLVVEEVLLSRGKNKLCATIRALHGSILKLRHHYRSRGPTQASLRAR